MSSPDSLTSLEMSPSPEAVVPPSPIVKGAVATTVLGRKPGVGGSDASSDLSELSSDGEAQRDHRQYKKPRHSSLDDLDGEEENSDQEDEDGELPSPQTASSSKRGPQSRKNGTIVATRKPSQSRMRVKSSSSNTTTTTTARRGQSPSKSSKARQQHHSPTFSKPNGAPASSYGKPPSRAPTHARHTRTKSESAGGNSGTSCAVAGPSSLNGHLNHPSAFAISAGLVGPTIGGDSDDDDDDILNGGRRSSRRNKRGVVPGPMWDWAIKKMHTNHSGMKKESSKSQKSNDDGHSGTNSPAVEDRKVSGAPDDLRSSVSDPKSILEDEDVKPDLASLIGQKPPQGPAHANESTNPGLSAPGPQSRRAAKGKRVRNHDGDGPNGSSSSDSNMSLATPPNPSQRRSNPKKAKSPRIPPSRSPSSSHGRSTSPSAIVPGIPNLESTSAPEGGPDGVLSTNGDASTHQTMPSTSNSSAFSVSIPNSGDEDEPKRGNDRKKTASQALVPSVMSSDEEGLGGSSPKLAAKKRTPSHDRGHSGPNLPNSNVPATPQAPTAPGSIPLPISPAITSGRPRGGSSLDLLADVIGTATGGARAGIDLHMSREVKEEAVMMEIEEAADHAQDTGKVKDGNDDSMEVDAEEQEDAGAKEGRDDGEEEQESEEDEPDPDAEADAAAPGRLGQNDDDEDDDDPEDDEDGRRRRPNKPALVTPDENENGADDAEEEEENDLENRESDHEDNGIASKHSNGNRIEKGDEAEEEVEADHDHEVENEIQPTQRAEALEILAAMELKFAMLRQRIYLDKMHETAREEKMLLEGTHPEYLTLLAELQRRRDRKLNLSELRRTKEEEFATHQRKAEEQAVWRQWNETKDDVRDELVAEANAKRRRLEREKRHIDAPKAVRTVQMPPAPSRSRRPPSPQTLTQTLKAYAKQTKANGFSSPPLLPGVSKAAPNLESLSQREAAMDLDLILGNSRRSSATAVAVHHQPQQPLPLPVQHIHPQQVPPHPQQQVHQPHPQSHPHPQSQQQMMYAPPPPNGYPPLHGYPHPQQQHGPPHQRYMTPAGYGHPTDYGSNGAGPYSHHPSTVQGGYVDGGGYDTYAPVQHYPGQQPPPAPQQHYPAPHPHPSQLPPPQQYHQQYHPQYAPQPPPPPHGQQYLHQPQPQRYILPPSDVALPPPPPPGYPRHNWPPPHAGPLPAANGPPNPNQNPSSREKVMIDLTNVPSPAPVPPHRSEQQQVDPPNRDRQRPPLMSPSREGGGPPPRPGSSLLAPIPTPHHDPRPPSAVSHFASAPRPHRDQPPPSGTPGIQPAPSPFKQPLSPSREIPAPIGPGYPLQSPTRITTPVSSVGGGVPRHSQSPSLMIRGPSTPLSHGLFNGTVDGPNSANLVPPPALSNGVVEGS
ncbi:hypothetical protein FRB95_005907 [Tulasnella sp. JGI-2019a]|nr:hypothetical protein FRB95_005907 [Tulasnella sp. JGI-2019a]